MFPISLKQSNSAGNLTANGLSVTFVTEILEAPSDSFKEKVGQLLMTIDGKYQYQEPSYKNNLLEIELVNVKKEKADILRQMADDGKLNNYYYVYNHIDNTKVVVYFARYEFGSLVNGRYKTAKITLLIQGRLN